MLKFAITGPESSGKTTLTEALANRFSGHAVPEFAREFLLNSKGVYVQTDLDRIAKGQLELWEKTPKVPYLFCDTEMLVLKIWSEFKYGNCSTFIEEAFQKQEFDHYFLCRPDIEWEEDHLREHPEQRDELFELYLEALKTRNLPFTLVGGTLEERVKTCEKIIKS